MIKQAAAATAGEGILSTRGQCAWLRPAQQCNADRSWQEQRDGLQSTKVCCTPASPRCDLTDNCMFPCTTPSLLLLLLHDSTHHNAVLVGVVLVLVLSGQPQAGPVVSLALQEVKKAGNGQHSADTRVSCRTGGRNRLLLRAAAAVLTTTGCPTATAIAAGVSLNPFVHPVACCLRKLT